MSFYHVEHLYRRVERMIGAGGFYSNGTSFQVEEGMENVTIELTDSMMVLGR